MCRKQPLTLSEMLRVSGVGERKCEQYGELFLQEILAWRQEQGLSIVADGRSRNAKTVQRRKAGDSARSTLSLLQQGKTVQEVAEERSIALATVLGHIEILLEQYDFQINLIAHNFFGFNSYIGEQSMSPITLYCSCNVVARYTDGLSNGKSGKSDKNIIFIVLYAFNFDSSNFVFFRGCRIEDHRAVIFFCGNFLCISLYTVEAEQACKDGPYECKTILHCFDFIIVR